MESLQCICIEVEFRTSTETCTIHGEFTDLREAATYLRKIADENRKRAAHRAQRYPQPLEVTRRISHPHTLPTLLSAPCSSLVTFLTKNIDSLPHGALIRYHEDDVGYPCISPCLCYPKTVISEISVLVHMFL